MATFMNVLMACMSMLTLLGMATAAGAQEWSRLPQERKVSNTAEAREALNDIGLFVMLNANVNWNFDRSDNTYLTPLSDFLDAKIFAEEKSGTLYPRKMAVSVLDKLGRGKKLNEIGALLVEEYKIMEFQSIKKERAEISKMMENEAQTRLTELEQSYTQLVSALEGLITMGTWMVIGDKRLDWDETQIPKIVGQIRGTKAILARNAAQTTNMNALIEQFDQQTTPQTGRAEVRK